MGRILVTDGQQRSSLAVVRSLGKRGLAVTVAEEKLPCLASTSKYCSDSFCYVSPLSNPNGFIDDLIGKLIGGKYDLIIPMTDITCYLLTQHKERLSQYAKVPTVDGRTFQRASDKAEVLLMSQKLGLPVPKTYFPEEIDEVRRLASCLSYPTIIKPRRSKFLTRSGWMSASVDYASSAEEMVRKFEVLDPLLPLPMIQERIQGIGCGAFMLFDHGQEKAAFFHRRIREKPPSGGVSVLRESISTNSSMREYAVRLLKTLSWHGVAMVEFKIDEKDNLPKIMEINPRFWGSLQLAIDSGLDFPYLLYRLTMNGGIETAYSYKVGVKSRWFLGDLDHLLIRLLKPDKMQNLPDGFHGRMKTLMEFLKLYQPKVKYEIFRRDDFRPAVFEIREYLKNMFKSLSAKILRS